METYTFLRSLADSWFLLLMMVVFRNDDRPAGDTVKTASRGTGSRQGAK